MKRKIFLGALSALCLVASASAAPDGDGSVVDLLFRSQGITKPVEPGVVPPNEGVQTFVPPPGESDQRVLDTRAGKFTVRQWYEGLDRPPVALYFLQRLGRVPPGWYGKYRVVIAGSREESWDNQYDEGKKDAGKENLNGKVTLGVERNTADDGTRARSPFVALVESSVLQELQAANFRLVDTGLVERALVAKRGDKGDHEYDALAAAARIMLEIEIVGTAGEAQIMGTLKSLKSGQILAIARVPVRNRLESASGVQSLSKALVRKLAESSVSVPDTATLE